MQDQIQLCSPRELLELFAKYNITPLKKLGQNFLVDDNVLASITSAAQLRPDGCCLEIGPGAGVLTERLARTAGRVVAVELDRGLIPLLHFTLQAFDNVRLVHGDALKLDLAQLTREEFKGAPFKVVANLPYNIVTELIMELLLSGLPIESCTFLMQKEVAARLSAQPKSKDYGALTVAVGLLSEVRSHFDVSPNCFLPRPKVDSTLCSLTIRPAPLTDIAGGDVRGFIKLVRALFAMRRKTLMNNLLAYDPQLTRECAQAVFDAADVRASDRAEALDVYAFARLFSELRLGENE